MQFLVANPLFLWLLPLAGLPILFHLFLRVRKRARAFSSLMFFLAADPRLSARRKIREWLALLLRVLAIAFLLLALARPVWLEAGRGGAAARVLVIDNSASMSAEARGGRTKLDLALEAAAALVGDLTERDAAGLVLLVQDPAVSRPPALTTDRAALRAALDQIKPTEAAGSPADALEQAFALLATGPAARREVHILTDVQQHEWSRTSGVPQAPHRTSVVVHRIAGAPAQAANVGVLEARLPARRLLAGRPYFGEATLANASAFDAGVRLLVSDDADRPAAETVSVGAGQEAVAAVAFRPETPGFHWLKLRIEQDGFEADNRAYLGFACGDKVRVVLAGREEAFGVLPLALAPVSGGALSGLVLEWTKPATLAGALGAPAPGLVAVTWSDLPEAAAGGANDRLRAYVEAGGTLLVLPAPRGEVPAAGLPDWLGAAPAPGAAAQAVAPEGDAVVVLDRRAALWDDLKDDRGEVLARGIRARRYHVLRAAPESQPLLGFEDGRPLLTARRQGRGTVFASGLALDTQSGNLPLKGSFVALVQSMALLQAGPPPNLLTLAAGERFAPALAPETAVQITSVSGGPLDWKGACRELRTFARSGVYLVRGGETQSYVVVSANAGEGIERRIDGPAVPALGEIAHELDDYNGTASLLARARRARRGLDGYLPLLALSLLAVLVEGWVVNPLPRKTVG